MSGGGGMIDGCEEKSRGFCNGLAFWVSLVGRRVRRRTMLRFVGVCSFWTFRALRRGLAGLLAWDGVVCGAGFFVGAGLGASLRMNWCFLGRLSGATYLKWSVNMSSLIWDKNKSVLGTSKFNGALYCALLLCTSLAARWSCWRSSSLSR
jgi:hypothetical protein